MQEGDTRIYGTPLVTDVSMDSTLPSNDPYTSQNVSYLSVRKEGGSIEQVNADDNRSHLRLSPIRSRYDVILDNHWLMFY